MRLKFIGEDGSMGYRNGKVYNLWFLANSRYIGIRAKNMPVCIYESPQSFAANWCKPGVNHDATVIPARHNGKSTVCMEEFTKIFY